MLLSGCSSNNKTIKNNNISQTPKENSTIKEENNSKNNSDTSDEAQKQVEDEDAFYFIKTSDSKKISLDEIIQFKEEKLSFARNEIFARKGYVFNSSTYQEYFSGQNWYKPGEDNSKIQLNEIEEYNVNTLKYYEDFFGNNEKVLKISNMSTFNNVEPASVDLNKDGHLDKIIYKNDEHNFELVVNNVSINGTGLELLNSFAVVDINSKDNYKEIIVSEYGASNDFLSRYYYYDGENIIKMGETQGIFEYGISIDGFGKIIAPNRAAILQTWFYNKDFKLNSNHKIIEVPQEIYKTNSILTVKKILI